MGDWIVLGGKIFKKDSSILIVSTRKIDKNAQWELFRQGWQTNGVDFMQTTLFRKEQCGWEGG